MLHPPKPPVGPGALAFHLRRQRDFSAAQQIMKGPGIRVSSSRSTGQTIQVLTRGTPRSRVSGTIVALTFIGMEGDYLVCSDGTNTFNVAKPFKLRHSIATETIDGDTVTYSDFSTTNQTRKATLSGTYEIQRVIPAYLVGDMIFAGTPDDTGVTDVTLLDLNVDGRAWAWKNPQP